MKMVQSGIRYSHSSEKTGAEILVELHSARLKEFFEPWNLVKIIDN